MFSFWTAAKPWKNALRLCEALYRKQLACAQLGMKECIVSKAQKVVRAKTTVMLSAKQRTLAVTMLRIENVSC